MKELKSYLIKVASKLYACCKYAHHKKDTEEMEDSKVEALNLEIEDEIIDEDNDDGRTARTVSYYQQSKQPCTFQVNYPGGYSCNSYSGTCPFTKGPVGPPGNGGEDGDDGPAGLPGSPGSPGAPGSPGGKGRTGPPGPPGKPGSSGKSVYNYCPKRGGDGKRGDPGADGATGQPGPAGAPGPKGDACSPAFGPAGEPGDPGEPGRNGQDGSPGSPGRPGDNGANAEGDISKEFYKRYYGYLSEIEADMQSKNCCNGYY